MSKGVWWLIEKNRVLMLFVRIALVVLFFCWIPLSGYAQDGGLGARPLGVDSTLAAQYQLADAFIRGGQYDRAIMLLEDLYAEHPQQNIFFEKLKEAYENVKRYDDAIQLIDDWLGKIRIFDATPMRVEQARLYFLNGNEPEAQRRWQAALDAGPPDDNRYRLVYGSMMQVRLFTQAITVLETGREQLRDSTLYQPDLAYLYSLTGRHEEAAEEYLGVLAQNDRQISYVMNRLSRFAEQEGALDASIAATERAVRRVPLNRSYRELLAWLYVEADRYRDALVVYRAIDRLEQEQGRVLHGFAQRAADAGVYDVALEAFDEVLAHDPEASVAPEVFFGLAEMHTRWAEKTREKAFDEEGNPQPAPHYDAALGIYRNFLERYPAHPFYPDALSHIGQLQQEVFFNLTEATTTLTEVTRRYPESEAAYQAQYNLGQIDLLENRLEEARLLFARIVEQVRTGELAERARFEQAQIHFYRGEFEAAKTLLSVLDENTSTDIANDAIALKVIIIENKGPDSLNTALMQYAEAALHHRQRRPEKAVGLLDTLLAEMGKHSLADEARFLRATALYDLGKVQEALAAFGEFPLIHPTSPLVDQSLFEMGTIQEHDLKNTEAALETYARILVEYPGSLLLPEVRLRIRNLRDHKFEG